ncbi:MAG TPA: Asp-tRNA(Asn)/Glu-tRNA(Gln) amidotransferase subunit GatA [Fimbriimonadaceae bacterium]|nr:Asp-tRNA(Asn)/Glu-tRNA(Gln) amidotransferase subunit GatA [Fimbriimonadaceae bacterium]
MVSELSATEVARALRERRLSVKEVLDGTFERIDKVDPDYSAFLNVCRDAAYEGAPAAQKLIDDGTSGPLTGVPVAIKDNMCTTFAPTTCGSKILEGFVPPYDATVVENIRRTGAIIVGKTNMDEFAMGTSTENSAYFPARNPWNPDLSPGGSSGGSAVAVAAEMTPISLGSDTGGSIRQPAALCGIVGFKPTYGRVSRYGLTAFASSLDQIGPFARNVEDAALLAAAVSGHDPMDSTSLKGSEIKTDRLKEASLKGLKIGLPKEFFDDSIQPEVRETLDEAIETLTAEGVKFKSISLPSIRVGVTTYYIIAPAEASSNLARFDGVRYGPRIEQGSDHIDMVSATRGRLFGHEVKLRIMVGTYALSAGYYDAYYHRAQQVRGLMASEFETAFEEFDLVLGPTSPCVAFPLGDEALDQIALKLMDYCTIPANMGGFPSISLPCGFANELPVGMLLTGPVNGDERVLQAAYAIERALPGAVRRPPMP